MIEYLAELNRLLLVTHSLDGATGSGTSRSAVVAQCRSMAILGRIADHEQTVEFAKRAGLLYEKKDRLYLTEDGRSFVALNPQSLYELSSGQKRLLLRRVYLDGPLKDSMRSCLQSFVLSADGKSLRWSELEGPKMEAPSWLIDHLRQLGFVQVGTRQLEISRSFASTVSSFLADGKTFTEEQLQEYLQEKKDLGDLAEDIVLAFETKRLRELGCLPEAACVRKVSKVKVNAGYDIESFNGKSKNMVFDRYIEVKGSGQSTVRFFWSLNEMATAKKIGSRYWIYFQGGIDRTSRKAKNKPVMLQDPINTVLNNPSFQTTGNGMLVEASLVGEKVQ